MVERIRTLLAPRQLTPTQFADLIGVGRPIISHILSGRNKPSLEVIQKVIAAFPDLAMPWLLSGIGPMWTGEEGEKLTVAEKPAKKPVSRPRTVEPNATEQAAPLAATPVSEVGAPPIETPAVPVAEPATPVAPTLPPTPALVGVTPLANLPLAALAEPDKAIRRIVIFYQDGTFSAFQPE